MIDATGMATRWRKLLILLLSGAITIGCGSGTRMAGIDRSGFPVVASGPITGFGSIILNGVRYDVSDAQISVNGDSVAEMDLAIGQIVTVSGTIDSNRLTGSLDSVVFEANVQGLVQSVDSESGELVVLGQHVSIDSDTVFAIDQQPMDLSSIAVDDAVQVSGFVAFEEQIRATRIARLPSLPEFRVVGVVDDLEIESFRFEINDLVVDYSGAQMIDGFESGEPIEGDSVLVRGSSLGGDGELLAQELQFRRRGIDGETGDEAEIEGLITRFVSSTDFDISGVPVTTTGATSFEGGSVASLTLDLKVEAEGEIDASGVLVADKIEVKDGGDSD